ncbi:hypothetical protein ES705_32702 [subsurface metagenome]
MFGKDTLSPTECKGKKFIRRRDLTPEKRLHISFMALQGVWGAVTELCWRTSSGNRNLRSFSLPVSLLDRYAPGIRPPWKSE